MYKKDFGIYEIEYSDCDLPYIDTMIEALNNNIKRIMDFFGIVTLDKSFEIKIWDSLDEFRENRKRQLRESGINREVATWVCASSVNTKDKSNIDMLSYKELLKCKSHDKDSINSLFVTIVHEFAHTCHFQYKNYVETLSWFNEAIATVLSNQYSLDKVQIDCEVEDLMLFKASYNIYFAVGKYILENYGQNFFLELAKNQELLVKESPRLFNEAKEWLNKRKNR